MVDLSEQEKERIRADMAYRGLVAAEQESATPKRGIVSAFFAHPATITVIGGLLIAYFTSQFQHRATLEQQKLAHARQLQIQKLELLVRFSEQFQKNMTLMYNMRTHVLEIAQLEPGRTALERTLLKEKRARYAKMSEEHWKSGVELALLLQVRALFTSEPVAKALVQLEKDTIALVGDDLTMTQIEELADRTQLGFRAVSNSMGAEIRGEAQPVSAPGQGR